MPIEVPSNSRFKLSTPVLSPEGVETFGLMKKFEFLSSENIIQYRVDNNVAHRPDLIATDYYGDPSYYWVVIMFNKPTNPFGWPRAQEIIKLPRKTIVVPVL